MKQSVLVAAAMAMKLDELFQSPRRIAGYERYDGPMPEQAPVRGTTDADREALAKAEAKRKRKAARK